MTVKQIANIIPEIQALTLASHNLKVVNKKKKSTKDIVGLGITNIAGTSLLQSTSSLIGTL